MRTNNFCKAKAPRNKKRRITPKKMTLKCPVIMAKRMKKKTVRKTANIQARNALQPANLSQRSVRSLPSLLPNLTSTKTESRVEIMLIALTTWTIIIK